MGADSIFVMTIDTEADDAWRKPDQVGLQNMVAIPRFQSLCDQYGIVPTYLLAYECASREEAISVLKPINDDGRCELGHHLHSWTSAPFQDEKNGIDMPWMHAYQFELSDTLFNEKALCLKETIEANYGVTPTSHRAGRWGIDQRTIDWLISNNFIADSSVIPRFNMKYAIGKNAVGPNFYTLPRSPYSWASSVGSKTLIEIPMTTSLPNNPVSFLADRYLKAGLPIGGRLERLYQNRLAGKMLRPNPRFSDKLLLESISQSVKNGPNIINMMIHSSELFPDCSPYTRTKEDHDKVWHKIELIFSHIQQQKIPCMSLTDAARTYSTKQAVV